VDDRSEVNRPWSKRRLVRGDQTQTGDCRRGIDLDTTLNAITLDLKIVLQHKTLLIFIYVALFFASVGKSHQDHDLLCLEPDLTVPPAYPARSWLSPRTKITCSPSPPLPHNRYPTRKTPQVEEEEDREEVPPHLTIHALSATMLVWHRVNITLQACLLPTHHRCAGQSSRVRSSFQRTPSLPLGGHAHNACYFPEEQRHWHQSRNTKKRSERRRRARFELVFPVPEVGAVVRLPSHCPRLRLLFLLYLQTLTFPP
jgi:hypothetical protein